MKETEAYKASIGHYYLVTSFTDFNNRRHTCLKNKIWCWENFKQNPFDIFYYLGLID